MIEWFATTLRSYPEIAIFLALGLGYYFGKFTFYGIGLGSVTATLLAAVVIGQLGITIQAPLKATVFLMFLFAVGYAVGPQFVRGIARDGLPQALFAAVQCVFALVVPVVVVKMAGYDLGMRPASMPALRPSRPRWVSRPTPSTGSGRAPTRPRPCSTGCRSPTR
jgi:putative transport protein